jgi:ATP-dependent exoDNAse (exonuclease V) alpha subunit
VPDFYNDIGFGLSDNRRLEGRSVTYGELDMLVPAYAATIHKSQGSEYPAVVIPVMSQHYTMQRNLLYTDVTRGKRLVVLVGQKKAVAIAVRNVSGMRTGSSVRSVGSLASNLAGTLCCTSTDSPPSASGASDDPTNFVGCFA